MLTRWVRIALPLLVLCVLLAACAPSTPPADSQSLPEAPEKVEISFSEAADAVAETDDSVILTDALGEEVTLKKNPQRVVSLINSYTALWYQAGGTVVGRVESTTELPPEALDPAIEIVGASFSSVSAEALLALEPDLVILRASQGGDLIGLLKDQGVPVLAMEYDSFVDYLKWLKVFTALTGEAARYEAQGLGLLDEINGLIAAVPEGTPPEVMLMFGTSKSVKAYLSNTAVGEMLSQLGAVNIADVWPGETGATSVDMNTEYLIGADPDFLLVQCMGDPEEVRVFIESTYGGEAWWQALSAVKAGRVVYLDRSLFHYKPNARYAEAYRVLGEILYPDAF